MSRFSSPFVLLWLLLASGGCGSSFVSERQAIVFVHGAGSDGPWYDGLRGGLKQAGVDVPIITFHWGTPAPLYMVNLQDRGIHEAAERKLAERIAEWRGKNPDGRITLLGHSAGCGVILGALGRLEGPIRVDQVVLLAPSVSPGYDLGPPLLHIAGQLHSFYSERDKLWLEWRTGTFGTYDNVRTPAAGHGGFTSVGDLDVGARGRVVQHPYQPEWAGLGNDGEHAGATAREFAAKVLAGVVWPGERR